MEKRAQTTLLKQKLGEIKECNMSQTISTLFPQCHSAHRTRRRTSWMSNFDFQSQKRAESGSLCILAGGHTNTSFRYLWHAIDMVVQMVVASHNYLLHEMMSQEYFGRNDMSLWVVIHSCHVEDLKALVLLQGIQIP